MKRIFFIGLFIFIYSHQTKAFGILQASGGRTTSIANCSVALSDFWSCHNNPAGFASQDDISIGFSYQNKFLLKELGYKNASVLIPFKSGTFCISASQFGYELYNENNFGFGFARCFGTNLRIGLKLDYLFFKFTGNYQNKSVPTFEIGTQYQINKSLCFGAYIFNPINAKLRTIYRDKIPIIIKLGLSYLISKDFLLTSEIEENFEYNFTYRFGLEYEIYKKIFIRSGFQFKPELFTFGIGYEYNKYTIDVCAQMSQTLGASISCSFIFKIKEIIKTEEGL